MRLIDADKLEKEMQNKCVGECDCCAGDCPAFIQPTAIDLVEHDKQIYNKALDDFINDIKTRTKWNNKFYVLAIEHCIEVAKARRV